MTQVNVMIIETKGWACKTTCNAIRQVATSVHGVILIAVLHHHVYRTSLFSLTLHVQIIKRKLIEKITLSILVIDRIVKLTMLQATTVFQKKCTHACCVVKHTMARFRSWMSDLFMKQKWKGCRQEHIFVHQSHPILLLQIPMPKETNINTCKIEEL